jgi:hypothetical protein
MPRYFFHVSHHASDPDTEGTELPDIHAAQAAAVRLCGEMIQEIDATFWKAPLWQLQVTDQGHRLLFTLTFSAEEQAALSAQEHAALS